MCFCDSDYNHVSYCAIAVDVCFFTAICDEEWIQSQVDMHKFKYEELTLECGELINILVGMTVHMERNKWRAVI